MRKLDQELMSGPEWKHADPDYTKLERLIVYDFWMNPNQTVQAIADRYKVSKYHAGKAISKMIREGDFRRKKLLEKNGKAKSRLPEQD